MATEQEKSILQYAASGDGELAYQLAIGANLKHLLPIIFAIGGFSQEVIAERIKGVKFNNLVFEHLGNSQHKLWFKITAAQFLEYDLFNACLIFDNGFYKVAKNFEQVIQGYDWSEYVQIAALFEQKPIIDALGFLYLFPNTTMHQRDEILIRCIEEKQHYIIYQFAVLYGLASLRNHFEAKFFDDDLPQNLPIMPSFIDYVASNEASFYKLNDITKKRLVEDIAILCGFPTQLGIEFRFYCLLYLNGEFCFLYDWKESGVYYLRCGRTFKQQPFELTDQIKAIAEQVKGNGLEMIGNSLVHNGEVLKSIVNAIEADKKQVTNTKQ